MSSYLELRFGVLPEEEVMTRPFSAGERILNETLMFFFNQSKFKPVELYGSLPEERLQVDPSCFAVKNLGVYVSPDQEKGSISAGFLKPHLKDRLLLNSNHLIFLLENRQVIPAGLRYTKDKEPLYVCFWGSVYCLEDKPDELYVPCLYWLDTILARGGHVNQGWRRGWRGVNPRELFDSSCPAAVFQD